MIARKLAPRATTLGAMAALAAFSAAALAAQEAAPGPWDPSTEAAAEAAVARLGTKRTLAIQRQVLAVTGLEAGVGARSTGIVARTADVQQAMADLGAVETELEVRIELPSDVLFDVDKADIRPDAAGALAKVATLLRAHPERPARLEGHTDAMASEAYNQRLSERRADAVKRWLVEREGVDGARLQVQGFGESRPVASNDTEEGRQKNRRVEVVIRKTG